MYFIFLLFFLFSSDLLSKEKNVYEIISDKPDLSVFKNYLDKTGLDDVLKKKIPYDWTIYAPSNKAFKDIPHELEEQILSDTYFTKRLFTDHILAKEVVSSKLTDQITTELTVSNKPVELYKSESLFIKDVVIIKEDLIASNGVIHIIDCIMFIQPSFQDDRLNSAQRESFPITSCCMQTSDEVSLWKLNTKSKF